MACLLAHAGEFELISQHTGQECPRHSLNLTLALLISCLLHPVSWLTEREPLIPMDLAWTAWSGSIEYDCSRSVSELGMRYTPIDAAVGEAVEDVKQRMRVVVAVNGVHSMCMLPKLGLLVFLVALGIALRSSVVVEIDTQQALSHWHTDL